MASGVRKWLILSGKLLIAGCLLAWVISRVEWARFATSMARLRDGVPFLLAALAGFSLALVVTAVRLRYLLGFQKITVRLWEVVRLTFLGHFFNAVVPGTVGGDVVKAYYLTKHTPKKAPVVLAVFVDRMIGLIGLTVMATAVLAWVAVGRGQSWGKLRTPAISVAVAGSAIGLATLFLLSRRFRGMFHLQKLYQRLPIAHHISAAGNAAMVFRRQPSSLLGALGITFCIHLVWVGSVALIGKSLALATPWYEYYLYVPLIYIIGAVPVAPGGVGLVEKAYEAFFVVTSPVTSQVLHGDVLALAMVARLAQMFCGLPGVIVAVTGAKVPQAERMRAELALDE